MKWRGGKLPSQSAYHIVNIIKQLGLTFGVLKKGDEEGRRVKWGGGGKARDRRFRGIG